MMMGRLPSHLVLIAVVVAAPETSVHEQIRSALATGEAALQASRWRASSDAYERALHLMKQAISNPCDQLIWSRLKQDSAIWGSGI